MNWKVIYVASRSEKKVTERLIQLGIEAYVPLKKEKRQWSDRKKVVITPLINGYVFVKVNEKTREIVFNVNSVLQYVRYNGADAIVRDIEIEVLKSIEQKGYYVEGHFNNHFKKGDKVIINHGPFKGLNGFVKQQAKENIYHIAIEGIGYALTVKVPIEVITESK